VRLFSKVVVGVTYCVPAIRRYWWHRHCQQPFIGSCRTCLYNVVFWFATGSPGATFSKLIRKILWRFLIL